MKKSILMSIRPQWLAKILNGEKTVEIRKQVPNWALEELAKGNSVDVYCYCTKKEYPKISQMIRITWGGDGQFHQFNGLVPCKFTLRTVVEFEFIGGQLCVQASNREQQLKNIYLLNQKNTQLTYEELQNYIGGKKGLALHITDLEIFDKPMELREFYKLDSITSEHYVFIPITRAPRSMQTVYVEVQR